MKYFNYKIEGAIEIFFGLFLVLIYIPFFYLPYKIFTYFYCKIFGSPPRYIEAWRCRSIMKCKNCKKRELKQEADLLKQKHDRDRQGMKQPQK